MLARRVFELEVANTLHSAHVGALSNALELARLGRLDEDKARVAAADTETQLRSREVEGAILKLEQLQREATHTHYTP